MMEAAIERHLAMLCQNHTLGCLASLNGTAKNPQTRWRHNGTVAPPSKRLTQQTPEPTPEPTPDLTPELTPSLPGMPPTSTGNNSRARPLEIVNLPAGYAYSHTSVFCAESFTLDISAQDSEHKPDYDPDMLPEEGTSTG